MKAHKKRIIWIFSLFLLLQCSGPNKNLVFWFDNQDFIWDDYKVNQSIEQDRFQFMPASLFLHAKSLEYPFLEWILPYYEVYQPGTYWQKNAIKWGACLADISYLALYQKNQWLNSYKNYSDSLKMVLFNGFELPEFYHSPSENYDSLQIWVATQLGSMNLICKTLETQQNLEPFVYFGAWLETLYILAHTASFKEDINLFLKLEEHKSWVNYYLLYCKKLSFNEWISQDVEWINSQLLVTQTVNVWDSVDNQFHLKTFPLKDPVINLQKNLSELRKKWILEN